MKMINAAAVQESAGVPARVQTSNGTDAGPSSISAPAPAAAPIHDFRDVTGDSLVKTWPITDWRAWERRTDMDYNDF